MAKQFQWHNALSTRPSLEAAITEVVKEIKTSLTDTPHVGILFISSAYGSEYSRLLPLLLEQLPIPTVIGCGGAGIMGTTVDSQVAEIEGNAAFSLSVAHLPEVEIHPFYLTADNLPDLDSSPQQWVDLLGVPPVQNPQFILFADPFSARINDLLAGLDFAYPGVVKVGGLASALSMGSAQGLFYHSAPEGITQVYNEGTIGVALSGKIKLDAIVAQGCRPIGKPYQVSQAERNIILEVRECDGGESNPQPPLVALRDIIATLSEADRQLAQHSLFVGIARDEFKLNLGQGDFLIRNLLGVEPKLGAIAIGDRVRPGQRLQFHLRDAQTSAEDLEIILQTYQQQHPDTPSPIGALMFSCLGRGEGLYGKPNFDSQLLRRYFPQIPLGGFFCNGEIGPVGGNTFLHGYTSVVAIIHQ